jgi:membrane-bound ClpP family serine protease
MSPLVWILLLLVVGLSLILLEVFVPSGGVLGLLAVTALMVGIVMAFLEGGAATGMAVLGGSFVAVPAVLMLAFRWFPATPLGRRVLHRRRCSPTPPIASGSAGWSGEPPGRQSTWSPGAASRSTGSGLMR